VQPVPPPACCHAVCAARQGFTLPRPAPPAEPQAPGDEDEAAASLLRGLAAAVCAEGRDEDRPRRRGKRASSADSSTRPLSSVFALSPSPKAECEPQRRRQRLWMDSA